MTRHTFLRICATGLLAGPLLFTVGDLVRRLVEPSGPSAADLTRAVGEHPVAWQAAAVLALVAGPLLVLGAIGLALEARGRGGRTTTIGAWMVAVGGFASIGHAVAFYSPYALYDRAGTPQTALRALDDASESYPVLVSLIALFIVGMMLGSIVLLVGLRRARRVPIWAPVGVVVFVVTGASGGTLAGAVGIAAAVVAFGPAARSLTAPAATVSSGTGSRAATLPG